MQILIVELDQRVKTDSIVLFNFSSKQRWIFKHLYGDYHWQNKCRDWPSSEFPEATKRERSNACSF